MLSILTDSVPVRPFSLFVHPCMSVSLPSTIRPSVRPFIHSLHRSIRLSVRPFIHPIRPSVRSSALPIHLNRLSAHPIHHPIRPSVRPSDHHYAVSQIDRLSLRPRPPSQRLLLLLDCILIVWTMTPDERVFVRPV